MKRLSKWWLSLCFLIIVGASVPTIAYAGNPDPDCDPGNPACPIDGGLTALLAVGVGYGIKKVRDSKKSAP